MIIEFFELSDDAADEITIRNLKRSLETHKSGPDPDSDEIVAACKKLIEYYSPLLPEKKTKRRLKK